MRFLITGANGFIGQALCAELLRRNESIRAVVRSERARASNIEMVVIDSMDGETDWSEALQGVDMVVHLAARVHVMRDNAIDPIAAFRQVNVLGTTNLARMAAQMGVKRLIFLSSVKVNGEQTDFANVRGGRECFSESDPPNPQDPYAISKWEAEQCLQQIAVESKMEIVVLRCPLVYGPGVKGNFLRLMQIVGRGIPLPLALVDNRRSLIFIDNLIAAIITCVGKREAAGKTYLVSDNDDVSTAQLTVQMALALGKSSRLWPVSPTLIRFIASLAGRSSEIDRLLGSLQIDSSKIRSELGWKPPYTLAQGLTKTAAWYLRQI